MELGLVGEQSVDQKLALGWVSKGDEDLRSAIRLASFEDADLDVVCYHAQQAAEKYLKSLLVYYQEPFKKSHAIDYLLDLLEVRIPNARSDLSDVVDLTDYAVETRYPDEPVGLSREDSAVAIKLARKARKYVVDHLPSNLMPPEPLG